MINYVLISSEQELGDYNPYADAEMCCYTCRMIPPPVWRNCCCPIHRNDRYEEARKNEQKNIKVNYQRYKYAFDDSHLQTTGTNIKRSNSMEILQIEPPITERDLKKAYKRMALKTHPDKCGNNDDFIKVNDAYNELLPCCVLSC